MAENTAGSAESAAADGEVSRVNVQLTPDAVEAMQRLRERTCLKKVDITCRALMLYEYVDAERRANHKIQVVDDDGNITEVRFF